MPSAISRSTSFSRGIRLSNCASINSKPYPSNPREAGNTRVERERLRKPAFLLARSQALDWNRGDNKECDRASSLGSARRHSHLACDPGSSATGAGSGPHSHSGYSRRACRCELESGSAANHHGNDQFIGSSPEGGHRYAPADARGPSTTVLSTVPVEVRQRASLPGALKPSRNKKRGRSLGPAPFVFETVSRRCLRLRLHRLRRCRRWRSR